jgi:hypothetical protein
MIQQEQMQKVFDKALVALRKQGQRSANGNGCMYRDGNGNACAIGHQFPDEDYLPEFDGDHGGFTTKVNILYQSNSKFRAMMQKNGLLDVPMDFLDKLQGVHDLCDRDQQGGDVFLDDFNNGMKSFGRMWSLTYTEPT